MPEHTTFLTMLLAHMRETLDQNANALGQTVLGHEEPSWRSFEAIGASLIVVLIVLFFALRAGGQLSKTDDAVTPEDRLTVRTFAEVLLGYFYDLAKSVMD